MNEIITTYALENHPFFKESTFHTPHHLWAMLLTGRSFKEDLFLKHMPALILHIRHHPIIASIMISQLNDEMGDGDYVNKGHLNLYEPLFESASRWRHEGAHEHVQTITQQLLIDMSNGLGEPEENVYRCLGAYVGTEIAAGAIIDLIGKLTRKHIDGNGGLEWVEAHDEVEHEHTAGVLKIVDHLPDDPEIRKTYWQGAKDMLVALRRYFSSLQEIEFAIAV